MAADDISRAVDSVLIDNVKAIAGKLAAVSAESFQDFTQNNSRRQQISDIAFAQWAIKANDMDPKEALSMVKGMGAADAFPEMLAKFGTLIADFQQMIKAAQTTRPQTGSGEEK